MFKVGDKVYDVRNGWGYVTKIDNIMDYPVYFSFSTSYHTYTEKGKYMIDDEFQSLLFEEIKIPESARTQPVELKVDDKIEVSDNEIDWSRRHFSHFEGGLVCTFRSGKTSFTRADEPTISWEYWRLPEDANL